MASMRSIVDGLPPWSAGLVAVWLGVSVVGCAKTEQQPVASAWSEEASTPAAEVPVAEAAPTGGESETAEPATAAPPETVAPAEAAAPTDTVAPTETTSTPEAVEEAPTDAAEGPAAATEASASETAAPPPEPAALSVAEPPATDSPEESASRATSPSAAGGSEPAATEPSATEPAATESPDPPPPASEPTSESAPPEPAPATETVTGTAPVEAGPSSPPAESEPFRLQAFLESKLAESPQLALAAFRQWVEERLPAIEAIPTYTADFYKQERLEGDLGPLMHMAIKAGHGPFRVYVRHLEPDRLNGQEAIYIDGKNNGRLIGHGVGLKKILGTLKLKPDSSLAMEGNKYPITHIGILHMARKTCERIDTELGVGSPEVHIRFGQLVDGRSCTAVELRRSSAVADDDFAFDRRYFDDEYLVPTRYEQYGWSEEPGAEAPLLEFYEYRNLRLGAELPANAFDTKNPDYKF